jgi:arginine repressor
MDNVAVIIVNTGGSEITGNAAGDNTIIVTTTYSVATLT